MSNSNDLTLASKTVQSSYEPWPSYWNYPNTYPNTYVYPQYIYTPAAQDYANEIEVEVGEHDATLHFYRSSGPNKGKTLVKTVTIPLSLLEWLSDQS